MDVLPSTIVLGNPVPAYVNAVLILIGAYIIARVLRFIATHYLKSLKRKDQSLLDDKISALLVSQAVPLFMTLAVYIASKTLILDPTFEWILDALILAVASLIAVLALSAALTLIADKTLLTRYKGSHPLIVKWFHITIRFVIASLALILYFDNIGIKITSLVAGFGIGGIAIAFAAQSILVDLFCWVTIVFDEPFEIGDFIVSGDQKGTVEHIGIKTTRLRSQSGEQLILANSDLTKARIANFKTLTQRRVLFRLGIAYETPEAKLREIPELIRSIVTATPHTRYERAHFAAFGPYSLDYEIVYFIESSDYALYMDLNQSIFLAIKQAFDERSIVFAYPTQTVQIQNNRES